MKMYINYTYDRVGDDKQSANSWLDTSQKRIYKMTNARKEKPLISLVTTGVQSKNHRDVPHHAHTAKIKWEEQVCWVYGQPELSYTVCHINWQTTLCKSIWQHFRYPRNSTSTYIPRRDVNIYAPTDRYNNVHNSTVCHSQKNRNNLNARHSRIHK